MMTDLIKSVDKGSEVILSDRKWKDLRRHNYLKQPCDQFADKKAYISSSDVFCKKGVLGNFAKFTGKRLCQRLSLTKLQAFLQLY